MSELLVNVTNQPVEVHLADNVVVVLGPFERREIELGDGPHPQLDELVRRMVVDVVDVETADGHGGPAEPEPEPEVSGGAAGDDSPPESSDQDTEEPNP